MRILVVEATAGLYQPIGARIAVVKRLRELGHVVQEADNSDVAAALMLSHNPQVVVLQSGQPQVALREFASRLKGINPDIPIVVLGPCEPGENLDAQVGDITELEALLKTMD